MIRVLPVLWLAACAPAAPVASEPARDVQAREGWSVGTARRLDLTSTCPVPAETADATLAADLVPDPSRAGWAHLGVLDALAAPGEPPLAAQLGPVCTDRMLEAHARGEALADLLAEAPRDQAIVVDLPGEEAIAVAAALAGVAAPIFVLDGWPHPDGVVPTHRTLGALLYWRSALHAAATSRDPAAPPVFVLDADRLAPLPPTGAVFDNRWTARLPAASDLASRGIRRVLYVRPRANDRDLDDVHPSLVAWAEAGIPARLVPMQAFQPDRVPDPLRMTGDGTAQVRPAADSASVPPAFRYWYGGNPGTHWWFWRDAGLGDPPRDAIPPRDAPSSWAPDPADTRPPVAVGRMVRAGDRWEPVRP